MDGITIGSGGRNWWRVPILNPSETSHETARLDLRFEGVDAGRLEPVALSGFEGGGGATIEGGGATIELAPRSGALLRVV